MNIVYGGSFNPPTLAHKAIIESLIKYYSPDNFIVIPVGDSYKRKNDLASVKNRIEMLKVLTRGLRVVISDIEAKEEKYQGTYYLLEELGKTYNDLYFVIGADNLVNIKSWINYELLLKKYRFIVITRGKVDVSDFISKQLNAYQDSFITYNLDIDINSSMIRDNLDENSYMLDDLVYEYIKKNKMYRR